jgi:hypothetical protein
MRAKEISGLFPPTAPHHTTSSKESTGRRVHIQEITVVPQQVAESYPDLSRNWEVAWKHPEPYTRLATGESKTSLQLRRRYATRIEVPAKSVFQGKSFRAGRQ